MILAKASQASPRVWRVTLDKEDYTYEEILDVPGIRFEGYHEDVLSLIYGYRTDVIEALVAGLDVDVLKTMSILQSMTPRPIDKIKLAATPIQDAIDLAVFLATVQVGMCRFVPGQLACGGPIDVMVLRTIPAAEILTYPGKLLHHPYSRGTFRENA